MHPFKKKSQMTPEVFKIALREAGSGVAQGWIVDVSEKCPGFATLLRNPVRRGQRFRSKADSIPVIADSA
jgi:hypothetical protein